MSQKIQELKSASKQLQKAQVKSQAGKKDHEMQGENSSDFFASKLNANEHHQNTSSMSRHKKTYSDALDYAVEDCSRDFWDTSQTLPLRSERSKKENSRYDQQLKQSSLSSAHELAFTETGKSVFSPTRIE